MTYTFTESVIPDDDTRSLPADVAPETDAEHVCKVCGAPVFRKSDRGRWPTLCDDHKGNRGDASARASKAKAPVAQAQKAAEVLAMYNGMIAGLLMLPFVGMPVTASALAAKNEVFQEQAAAALVSDPALCKAILRSGVLSGRAALILSYGMLVGSLAPIAVTEYRQRGGADA